MNSFIKNNLFFSIITAVFLSIGITMGMFFLMPNTMMMNHNAEKHSGDYNKEVVFEQHEGIKNLLAQGRYKCCLEKPCSYCFSKTEHHDEELVCDCLVEVMNGEAPCGECIGEILEGEGNPLIAEYFATSIADKLGQQYIGTLKQIIAEKYNMPVSKQL
jgi:hypothetical protein